MLSDIRDLVGSSDVCVNVCYDERLIDLFWIRSMLLYCCLICWHSSEAFPSNTSSNWALKKNADYARCYHCLSLCVCCVFINLVVAVLAIFSDCWSCTVYECVLPPPVAVPVFSSGLLCPLQSSSSCESPAQHPAIPSGPSQIKCKMRNCLVYLIQRSNEEQTDPKQT